MSSEINCMSIANFSDRSLRNEQFIFGRSLAAYPRIPTSPCRIPTRLTLTRSKIMRRPQLHQTMGCPPPRWFCTEPTRRPRTPIQHSLPNNTKRRLRPMRKRLHRRRGGTTSGLALPRWLELGVVDLKSTKYLGIDTIPNTVSLLIKQVQT